MKNRNLIISILFAVLILCSAFLCFTPLTANADSEIEIDLFLPQTDLEYKKLSAPIAVYSDEKVTAIIESDQANNVHALRVFFDNNYLEIPSSFNTLAMSNVKKLNDNTLLLSDNGNVYTVDLPSFNKQPLYDTSNALIGGTFFDINQNYLITSYENTAIIYERTQNSFNKLGTFSVKNKTPVAINDSFIYFVSEMGLRRYNLQTKEAESDVFIAGVFPDNIIANNNFVYCLTNNTISRIDTNSSTIKVTELEYDISNTSYDLGNIINPTNISFRGENLLVIQGDTIQEFKIEGDTLEFTGFAITEGKTAYNRVNGKANNAKIQKYNNTIAVLDDFKLSIINNNQADQYNKENFTDYIITGQNKDLESFPDTFALGDDSLVLKTGNQLSIIDLTKNKQPKPINIEGNNTCTLLDVYYQSGYYYVLATYGVHKKLVYKFNSLTTTLTNDNIIFDAEVSDISSKMLAVDVYENIYLSSETLIKVLVKSQNNYVVSTNSYTLSNITKLQTDLRGNLYILANNNLYLSNNLLSSQPTKILDTIINSFAMDITSDSVYLLFGHAEFISVTSDIENLSIEDLVIPNTFKQTNDSENTANDSLRTYTTNQNENVFVVTKNQNSLKYKEICEDGKKFIYACPITDANSKLALHLLIGQDEIAICLSDTNCQDAIKNTNCPETAYISSSVNGYYYPIITLNADYVLTRTIDNELNAVRLDKNTKISPEFKTTILDKDYYYASFVVDNTTYKGYIPIDYTVEVLEKDFSYEEYTIETLKNTSLYSDSQLTNKIDGINIDDGTAVRVYEKQQTYAKIAVNVNGEWIYGYVSTDVIIDNPAIAIRNVLLIILVVTSLCTTSIYFLLKKKRIGKKELG